MTIKELLKSAFIVGSGAHKAVLNDEIRFEISYYANEDVKYILNIHNFQLDERAKGFNLLDTFSSHDIIEIESLYSSNHLPRKSDYNLKSFFEDVLLNGISRPLLNFSLSSMNGSREHKILSKVEDGKFVLELLVELNSGVIHPKGKLVPKE